MTTNTLDFLTAKKCTIPDEKYEKADTDPGVAYELGRKDGRNALIDEIISALKLRKEE